jgi:ABC-type branched-subunit amino acid transport system permease subunit
MLGKNVWQTVLTYGLGLGLARFGLNLVAIEWKGPRIVFESIPLAMIALALTIVVMIGVGFKIRKDNGGLLDLQSGLLALLGVYASAGLLAAVCNGLYFHVFRPELLSELTAYADRLSRYGMIREFFSSLIFGGLMSVIFALVLKREQVKVSP